MINQPVPPPLPPLTQLGLDLLTVHPLRRLITLAMPFACVAGYFAFACGGLWPAAVVCVMYLSFITYGSISHDLVHRTLRLPRAANEILLTVMELLAFRSGHAYRLVHLQHHARFPHEDDVEGAAAKMSFLRALAEGFIYLPRLTLCALRKPHCTRPLVLAEVAVATLLFVACMLSLPMTPVFGVYAILMLMGSWVFPLATSYFPHHANGQSPLTQTRLFRGKVLALIALQHLYHLEHHLYPSVPHHNWPKLARRLDPFFAAAHVRPVIWGF